MPLQEDFYLHGNLKYITLGTVLIYIFFFAILPGPLGWLIISEVFPLKVCGLGMSIGSLSDSLFNGIITFTFLKLAWVFTADGKEIVNKTIDGYITTDPNPEGAFFIYALVDVLGIIWGLKYIPETKEISLEGIEEHWLKGKKPEDIIFSCINYCNMLINSIPNEISALFLND